MKHSKLLVTILIVHTILQAPIARGDFYNGGFEPGDFVASYVGGDVGAVQYEYASDFSGLSQPPYTTGPNGTPAWYPAGGAYFLSMKTTAGGASMQFEFTDRPAGQPLTFSCDWFFDYGGLKPNAGGRYDIEVVVSLTAYWGLMYMNSTSINLVTINNALAAEEVYMLDSDENLDWSKLAVPLADMPLGGPPMDYGSNIRYVLEANMYGIADYNSILGFDNIRLATDNIVPVPGAALLGMIGLGAAGLKWRKYA